MWQDGRHRETRGEKKRNGKRRAGKCDGCGKLPPAINDQHQKHHKNADHGDDSPDNLEFVCYSCHHARHLQKQPDGTWLCVMSEKVLTPRDLVAEIDARKVEFSFIDNNGKKVVFHLDCVEPEVAEPDSWC